MAYLVSALPLHSTSFRARRVLNWFPLGLAYAFLYMGRYNLTVAKNALGHLMTSAEFGQISAVGTVVYGLAFVINGPLTDRVGGRRVMLIAVAGALIMNVLMGCALLGADGAQGQVLGVSVYSALMVLYALNMYFQSFGAVAIVTVKAPWFHVRERGSFSTIFGIMITAGIYFAFDWGYAVVQATRAQLDTDMGAIAHVFAWALGVGGQGVDANWWIFFTPAVFLSVLLAVLFLFLRNTPKEAGYEDFDTGESSVAAPGEVLSTFQVFVRILTHPVLLVICAIEFCTGVLRNGTMQWYPIFAKETGIYGEFFVTRNWGLLLLGAGVIGAFLTGWASDRFFQSRRAPMAAFLYVVMGAGVVTMAATLDSSQWMVGGSVVLISMSVIGVHGILSGTSTADFGGSRNTGTAVGLVDGLVYLGTALQYLVIGQLAPTGEAARDPSEWRFWPVFMLPFVVIGILLSVRIWNALPSRRSARDNARSEEAQPAPAPTPATAGGAGQG
ncbi:MAG: MFS transporter [Deltaproteobacteria bacterium]|nr:MFS transporter [Deltaproteobacteria bacterium]